MNTPAHLLLGAAAFGRKRQPAVTAGAIAGALLPDVSLYLMAGVSLFVLRIAPQRVFDELYFSTAWQTVFAIDNSFVLWGGLLAFALWRRIDWLSALAAAALLHLACDLPLHHDDGRPHFWPITSWVFESPYSYWDSRQGAAVIAPLEGLLSLAAALWLFARHRTTFASLAIMGVLGLEAVVIRQWLLFF